MAASELRVQPQLAHALAARGSAAGSEINKQQHSGVAIQRRAKIEVFIASPEKRKRQEVHLPVRSTAREQVRCSWRSVRARRGAQDCESTAGASAGIGHGS